MSESPQKAYRCTRCRAVAEEKYCCYHCFSDRNAAEKEEGVFLTMDEFNRLKGLADEPTT